MHNKISIVLSLILFTFYSCSKSSPQSPVNNGPTPTMTYYFNDSLVTIAGNGQPGYARTLPWIACFRGSSLYSLSGQDASSNSPGAVHNNLNLNFIHDSTIQNTAFWVGDSLQVHTYHFNTHVNSPQGLPPMAFVRVEPDGLARIFAILNTNDNFTVTITRYSKGTIDGAFSGTLSGLGGNSSVAYGQTGVITRGEFSNVPVVY